MITLGTGAAVAAGAVLLLLIGAGAALLFQALRLRGHFFAIFTLCVGTVLFLVIEKWDALTRGVVGIMDIPRPPALGPLRLDTDLGQYYLVTAALAVGLFVMAKIVGFCGKEAFQYYPQFIPIFLRELHSADADIREVAAEAIGMATTIGKDLVCEIAPRCG